MTRAEFIRDYAASSGIPTDWAELGLLEVRGKTKIALPCACERDGCPGWALLAADEVLDHLEFRAPEKLRDAYNDAVSALDQSSPRA
ncbi:MAG: hypothetical protein IT337_15255 [Thermomicrobiales bacterium]|nr:hypothetical protein [Thermomicrobiales bacterium]